MKTGSEPLFPGFVGEDDYDYFFGDDAEEEMTIDEAIDELAEHSEATKEER